MSKWDECKQKLGKLTDDELRIEVIKFTTPGNAKRMTRNQMIDKIAFWECKGSAFSSKGVDKR